MKYSPPKTDSRARLLYCLCLIGSAVCLVAKADGLSATILSSFGLVLLVASIYLFVKYDMTSYEYILIERNGTFDFYVNKITGRRGNYACYFPLSDCLEIAEYKESTKEELLKKHAACKISKYVQNFLSEKNLYYALFRNGTSLDCIVFEPSEEMVKLISDFAGKSSLHSPDDEASEIVVDDTEE